MNQHDGRAVRVPEVVHGGSRRQIGQHEWSNTPGRAHAHVLRPVVPHTLLKTTTVSHGQPSPTSSVPACATTRS
ncbi:hypothetical protein [Streptomyces sp. NPDC056190]|uniref:hypothetical protein n=1 Tax=unclassified Streptomyces TaxID=2593676 RepID=UPI0035E0C947